jgi:hypothetical protein
MNKILYSLCILCILCMQWFCMVCMSSALPVHHGNSSASLFVQHIYPSSLGVILKFLRIINSPDSSSSIPVELNLSVAVNGSNALPAVNRLHEQSFLLLVDAFRLFTSSVNHAEVSSSPLAETISGFWQLHCDVQQ